jgi:O-antigen/teichoic acid export membrane protein
MRKTEDAAPERPKRAGVGSALGWIASGQVAYGLFQFLTSVVLARLLTPHDVGIYALAASVVGFINVLQMVGLNNYIIRCKDLTPQVATTVFSVNLALSFALSAIIVILALASRHIFGEAGIQKVLACLGFIPVISAVSFTEQSTLERNGLFRQLTLVRTSGVIIGTCVTLVAALRGASYMSLAYGQIVTVCATTIMAIGSSGKWKRPTIGFSGWRDVTAFAGHSLLTGGVSRLFLRLQELALGKILGLSELGLYSRASNVFSMLWDNIFIVINRVLFVDFSHQSRAGAPLGERYQKSLSMVTAAMWPAFAGLGILSSQFIVLVFGEKWQGAATSLTLLCVTGMIYTSVALIWDLFVLAHETARQAKIESTKTIIGSALFIGGCFISLEAAIAARVVEAIVGFIIYLPYLSKFTETPRLDLMKIYAVSAGLTISALLPIVCLLIYTRGGPGPSVGSLAVAIGFGVACWVAHLYAIGHPLFLEGKSLLRRKRAS